VKLLITSTKKSKVLQSQIATAKRRTITYLIKEHGQYTLLISIGNHDDNEVSIRIKRFAVVLALYI